MEDASDQKRLKVVGIRLDDEMHRELKNLADSEHRKLASFIVVALRRYLDTLKQGDTSAKKSATKPRPK
jgi:predicted transcriptional regulator